MDEVRVLRQDGWVAMLRLSCEAKLVVYGTWKATVPMSTCLSHDIGSWRSLRALPLLNTTTYTHHDSK